MIAVKVKSIFNLTTVLMGREIIVNLEDGSRLQTLLDTLEERFGSKLSQLIYQGTSKELSSALIFVLNGRNVFFLNGVETILEDGDELFLFPRICGG